MTAPEPTRPADEHTDAVARVLYLALPDPDVHRWDHLDTLTRAHYRTLAAALLTTPAVHAAMLAALVRAGVLTAETAGPYACPAEERSPWGGWVRCGKFDNHEDDHEDSTSGWHWPRDPDDLEDVPATPPHRLVTPWEVAP